MFKHIPRSVSFLVIAVLVLVFVGDAFCGSEESKRYSLAVKAAKSGSLDFAFMNYRALLKDFPKSRYREKAIFSSGEYHALLPEYKEAKKAFGIIIKEYPESEGKLFALAYLLKIAQVNKQKEEEEKIKEEIIAFKRNSFLFEESKYYEYMSPLYQEHRALFFIDRIEFYVQDKFFAKMEY